MPRPLCCLRPRTASACSRTASAAAWTFPSSGTSCAGTYGKPGRPSAPSDQAQRSSSSAVPTRSPAGPGGRARDADVSSSCVRASAAACLSRSAAGCEGAGTTSHRAGRPGGGGGGSPLGAATLQASSTSAVSCKPPVTGCQAAACNSCHACPPAPPSGLPLSACCQPLGHWTTGGGCSLAAGGSPAAASRPAAAVLVYRSCPASPGAVVACASSMTAQGAAENAEAACR